MLCIQDDLVGAQVPRHMAQYNVFKYLQHKHFRKIGRYLVGSALTPFQKISETNAFLQLSGNSPVVRDYR